LSGTYKRYFAGYVPIRTACYAHITGIVQLFSYHDSAIASCGICFHILVMLGQAVKRAFTYLAAGTAGATVPQKAGYGTITDRVAG
jgi:hypothetical protein